MSRGVPRCLPLVCLAGNIFEVLSVRKRGKRNLGLKKNVGELLQNLCEKALEYLTLYKPGRALADVRARWVVYFRSQLLSSAAGVARSRVPAGYLGQLASAVATSAGGAVSGGGGCEGGGAGRTHSGRDHQTAAGRVRR